MPADNPPVPVAERTRRNWAHAGDLQRHLFDSNLPENVETLDVIRRRVEAHNGRDGGDRFVFGEFSEEEERCGAYLTPAEVLRFRDNAFVEYTSDPAYLALVRKKFGEPAVDFINGLLKIKLRRKLLEPATA